MYLACEEKQWRGQKLWCCSNGTKHEIRGKVVWSELLPPICKKEKIFVKEEVNTFTIVIWTLAIIGSFVCCGLCGRWYQRRNREN